MVPDCNTNFRNGFAALDNPYKVVLDDSLNIVHLDEKLNIITAILAAILDSGDRIATPTSGMVFAALDNPYKVVLDDSLVHLDYKLDILAAILAAILGSHDRIAKPSSAALDNP